MPQSERVIGSIQREGLDPVLIFNERHLRRLLTSNFHHAHRWRTHLSLAMDCPESRPVQPPEPGTALALPKVGGLHHSY